MALGSNSLVKQSVAADSHIVRVEAFISRAIPPSASFSPRRDTAFSRGDRRGGRGEKVPTRIPCYLYKTSCHLPTLYLYLYLLSTSTSIYSLPLSTLRFYFYLYLLYLHLLFTSIYPPPLPLPLNLPSLASSLFHYQLLRRFIKPLPYQSLFLLI